MKIEWTGRHTVVPAAVRRQAEQGLQKLAHWLPRATRAHVVLSTDKHRQTVEITVHSPRHLDLSARAVTGDVRSSMAEALDRLGRQAQKRAGRRRERNGHESPRKMRPAEDGPAEERPRVIRSRRLPVKPMTLDEAVFEIQGRSDGVLVYRDARNSRVSVLYRRRDGDLSLIEAED